MLSVVMLNVVMLNVVMLSVVVPTCQKVFPIRLDQQPMLYKFLAVFYEYL